MAGTADARENRRVTPRPRYSSTLLAGAALTSVLVLAGCGSNSATSGPQPTSVSETVAAPSSTIDPNAGMFGTTDTSPTVPGQCVSRMPGQGLTPDEAVVYFSTESVCPGYVTVGVGVPVTFANTDDVAHRVTVHTGATGTGDTLLDTTIEPGQSYLRAFTSPGVLTYQTDALPSFRGTIEVLPPGTVSHG